MRLTGISAVEFAPPSVIVKTGGNMDGRPLSSTEGIKTLAGVASDVEKTTAPFVAVSQLATDDEAPCTLTTRIAVEISPTKKLAGLRTDTVCVVGFEGEKDKILGDTMNELGLKDDVDTGCRLIETFTMSPAFAEKRVVDSRR